MLPAVSCFSRAFYESRADAVIAREQTMISGERKVELATVDLIAGTVLLLLHAVPGAGAHGDADWITQLQLGCCGPSDCTRVEDGVWQRTANGFLNSRTLEFVPWNRAQSSIDRSYWECRTENGHGLLRGGINGPCLFAPAIGF
jgi:hypothetical protein